MAGYWGDGFSKLFKFGMQMVLVLLTGYVLALTPAVQSMLTGLTRAHQHAPPGPVLTIVVSFVCYYLNWGFGMVAGAILAREMGRRVAVHFPLIVAAAYGGELVRGPSSSIPLVIATPDHFMEDAIGIVPVSETLYSGWNIALTITLLVLLVIFFLLQKQPERIVRLDDSRDDRPDHPGRCNRTQPSRVHREQPLAHPVPGPAGRRLSDRSGGQPGLQHQPQHHHPDLPGAGPDSAPEFRRLPEGHGKGGDGGPGHHRAVPALRRHRPE